MSIEVNKTTDEENGEVIERRGTCECGQEIDLTAFTNECHSCGRLYNCFGQALKPVHMWMEPDDY